MNYAIHNLNALEQLSCGSTFVHRLNPTAKLLATLVFIITVISFNRYAFWQLLPYICYPTLLMAVSKTPYTMLFKRFMIAFPFCFFAGLSNMIFTPYGAMSLLTILLRTYLCVMAVLLLVSVTPFFEIAGAMRSLKIPAVFIVIIEMTYRYICVLVEEVYSMYVAYLLRSRLKGIRMKDMSSFAGQLLLRSFDRADRVYNAMKCRGYADCSLPHTNMMLKDFIFLISVCIFCALFRFTGFN